MRPYDRPHGRKLVRNLGEDYSLENIRKRILAQRRLQRVETPEPRRCRLLGDLKQARKVTGFRALYFHYCYLLGVFPQKQNRQRGHVPHALRNDLIRAEELTDEARLLSRQRVDTLEQLSAYQSDVEARLVSLTEQRKTCTGSCAPRRRLPTCPAGTNPGGGFRPFCADQSPAPGGEAV